MARSPTGSKRSATSSTTVKIRWCPNGNVIPHPRSGSDLPVMRAACNFAPGHVLRGEWLSGNRSIFPPYNAFRDRTQASWTTFADGTSALPTPVTGSTDRTTGLGRHSFRFPARM